MVICAKFGVTSHKNNVIVLHGHPVRKVQHLHKHKRTYTKPHSYDFVTTHVIRPENQNYHYDNCMMWLTLSYCSQFTIALQLGLYLTVAVHLLILIYIIHICILCFIFSSHKNLYENNKCAQLLISIIANHSDRTCFLIRCKISTTNDTVSWW